LLLLKNGEGEEGNVRMGKEGGGGRKEGGGGRRGGTPERTQAGSTVTFPNWRGVDEMGRKEEEGGRRSEEERGRRAEEGGMGRRREGGTHKSSHEADTREDPGGIHRDIPNMERGNILFGQNLAVREKNGDERRYKPKKPREYQELRKINFRDCRLLTLVEVSF
jgi:hypothetical protein